VTQLTMRRSSLPMRSGNHVRGTGVTSEYVGRPHGKRRHWRREPVRQGAPQPVQNRLSAILAPDPANLAIAATNLHTGTPKRRRRVVREELWLQAGRSEAQH
jgi:hypothetical protein